MKKIRLRKKVLISLYFLLVCLFAFGTLTIFDGKNTNNKIEEINYVSSIIWSNDTPVISTDKVIIKPYVDKDVKVAKYYYNYKDSAESQQNSIIFYEDTYMQNSGIDYILENVFEVVSVLDGVVTKVEENELVGKTIEIKHENNIISVYQGLSEVSVKEGQQITQNTLVGKSGKSTINKELGNHLHFEIYISGQVVNPLDCFDKNPKDL